MVRDFWDTLYPWSADFDDLRVFSLAMQNKLELSVCLYVVFLPILFHNNVSNSLRFEHTITNATSIADEIFLHLFFLKWKQAFRLPSFWQLGFVNKFDFKLLLYLLSFEWNTDQLWIANYHTVVCTSINCHG